MKKIIHKTFSIIIILYAILIIASCNLQTQLIFYPIKLEADYKFERGEEVFIKTSDENIINALYFNKNAKKTILYFHGNAGALNGWQFINNELNNINANLLIIDYRGYGKSTGKISEKGFYLDGQAAFNYLTTNKGIPKHSIIIYGRSIGSGVAVEIASKNEIHSLILEAPFNSLKNLISNKYPFLLPKLYLKYNFDNVKKINNVNAPILILHGTKDKIIPIKFGKKLYDSRLKNKNIVIIPNGSHNNLSSFQEYNEAIQSFLK